QQANAHWAEAQQAHHQIAGLQNQLTTEFQSRFPEIQSEDDLRNVASYDQDRAVEAVQYLQQAEQVMANAQQAAVGRVALAQEALNVWGAAEDQKFIAANPDLKDEKVMSAVRGAALEVLRGTGMSDEQISAAWHGGMLRSAEAQTILAKAAKQHLLEQRMKGLRATPLPPVVRPSSRGRSRPTDALESANRKL